MNIEGEVETRISEAFAERRTVRLLYSQGRQGARPYWTAVNVYAVGRRYLDAYQRSNRQVRTFRLDRIQSATVLDDTYEIPPDYVPSGWVTQGSDVVRGRGLALLTSATTAQPWSPWRRVLVGFLAVLGVYVVLVGINSWGTGAAWVALPENRYWYCWDEGIPRPHHLGHPAPDDHFCTGDDVKDIRNFLYPPWITDPWK